jgi:predicted GTPase
MEKVRVVIMGAAGRDFHNFNVVFRDDPHYDVLAFTAAQIPGIAGRSYPPELAGKLYPAGIPIVPERDLAEMVARQRVDEVVFSYSDVAHIDVMHKASVALAYGADFRLLSTERTMLRAQRPVISVCAVRTGCGKSPAARRVASILAEENLKVAILRHPMPYGDLAKQAVQRFATLADLAAAECTIEEMEEYEPHIAAGHVVYAGVDYERILRRAEMEAEVILWDGGNNDTPFVRPDLEIVLVDPHRPGHERAYHPGETNLLRADVIVVSKADTAAPLDAAAVRQSVAEANQRATVVEAAMPVRVSDPSAIAGKRVLAVEDGPTLTHGGMAFGAASLAARKFGAAQLVDPRPAAVGTVARTFREFTHLGAVLPAMGYGREQVRDLEATIRAVDCDLVLVGTPIDLRRVIEIRQPTCRATYELVEIGRPTLQDLLYAFMAKAASHGR